MKNELMMKEAPVKILFAKLCIPTIVIMLVMVVYNMADIFFVGRAGDATQVAAVSLSGPVYSILSGLGTLLGAGGSTAIAIALGKGEKERVKKITAFCFYMALGLSIGFAILTTLFIEPIVSVLGAEGKTATFTAQYVRMIGIGAPFILISNVFANIVRSDGSAKISMVSNLLGTITNIILDPIFISGLKMGVQGAAIATVIGNMVSSAYLMYYVMKRKDVFSLAPRHFTLKKTISLRVMSLGLPLAISTILMSLSSVFSNNLYISYGDVVVAANGVASKPAMLIAMLMMGICMGMQPAISYNYGAGNWKRLHEITMKTGLITVATGAALSVILFLIRNQVVAAFISDSSVQAYGVRMMMATLLSGPIVGLYQLSTTFLQGTGKVSYALILSILRQGALFVPILFISNYFGGLNGLIFSNPITDALAVLVGCVLSIRWKGKMQEGIQDEH